MLFETLSWIVAALLVAATSRRLGLLLGALIPPRHVPESGAEPDVVIVVAAKDEARQLEPLLRSFEALEYPKTKLSFVLVNDGSTDGTGEMIERWCRQRPGATAIHRGQSAGKSSAIRAALEAAHGASLVAVYDADLRPRPDSLRILSRAFTEERVGAASGYRRPLHAGRSIVSRYAALEAWVYQLVVQAGKDRWNWNPPTMGGNCVYRLRAVEEAGGFPGYSYSEDVELSLGMVARGWRTRFLVGAVADGAISGSLRHYTNQRSRWSYGMYHSFRHARGLEALAVVSGYADRVVFAAGCLLAVVGQLSPGWLFVYLLAPVLESIAALQKAGDLRRAPAYLLSAIPMFAFDVAFTIYCTLLSLAGRRPKWDPLGRPEAGP